MFKLNFLYSSTPSARLFRKELTKDLVRLKDIFISAVKYSTAVMFGFLVGWPVLTIAFSL